MTIHIGENITNVQMPCATSHPIDVAAECAVEGRLLNGGNKISHLEQLIKSHKSAEIDRQKSLRLMDIAETKLSALGGRYTKFHFGYGFDTQSIIIGGSAECRQRALAAIDALYDKLSECRGFFGNVEKHLETLSVQRSRFIEKLNKTCDVLEHARTESKIDEVEEDTCRTYTAEDQAICKILAFVATTPAERFLKSKYLLSSQWYQEFDEEASELPRHHFKAMMKGMGCEVAL